MTPLRAALVALVAMLVPPQTVFRSGVDAVRVDVLVTRGGRPVAGLTASDFELRDSGVRQQIEAVALEDVPLHLLLALDMSASMAGEPLRHLKEAAHAAVGSLGANDRVSLLAFSHVVQKRMSWSGNAATIGGVIDSLEAGGSTSLTDAAFAALAMRESVDGRMLLLLFTDGLDTASWLDPLAVVDAAKRTDLVVDAVRLDSPANQTNQRRGNLLPRDTPAMVQNTMYRWFLEEPRLFRQQFLPTLADETGGELIVASQSRDLRGVFVKIVSEFKTRYVLTYSPQNVPPSGWHPLEVKLTDKKGEVRARRGYTR